MAAGAFAADSVSCVHYAVSEPDLPAGAAEPEAAGDVEPFCPEAWESGFQAETGAATEVETVASWTSGDALSCRNGSDRPDQSGR